jgi:hypothetical protein
VEQLEASERVEWLERVAELKAAKNKLQSFLDDANRKVEQLEDEVEELKHSLDAEDAADAELKKVVEWVKQLDIDWLRGSQRQSYAELIERLVRLEHRR